ncbi:hypothetical protein F2Q69_00038661 [Brassica cretica]|uniref:Uncharacterized protein n=1 Tax=Brassica cretica TaxID=69181 RepID=A0A8S9SPR4_BRACR|nr:hypothetical protein F2Q69_00038661 [Brassica cretica]
MFGCRGLNVLFVSVDSGDISRQIIRYFSDKLMKSPSDHAAGIIDGSYHPGRVRNLSEKHCEVPGLEVVIVVARFMKLTSDPDVHGMFGTLSEERHKRQGAAIINVGTNAVSDTSRKSGYRLVGDVDFAQAS